MAKTLLPCLCFLFCFYLSQAAPRNGEYHGYRVLRLTPQQATHIRWLRGLQEEHPGLNIDFWTDPTRLMKPVDVMIGPNDLGVVTELLTEVNFPYKVLMEDLQKSIDEHTTSNTMAMLMNAPPGNGIGVGYDFTRYMRYHEISTGGAGKRKVWVDAGIHAREWVSPTTGMYFIERLITDYWSDPEVKLMLDTFDFYILPLINADGYEYTHTNERLWRKSRTIHVGDACYGTDINRNFDHMWDTVGTSRDSCSQTYSGPYVHSEIESRNMADFILGMKGEWEIYLTLHSYSQLWMAPWGYSVEKPSNYNDLMRVANRSVASLTAVHGTEYQAGSASEILYASSGTSRDWAYGTAEIPYVYTIELRDTGNYGFLLPPEQILPTAEETYAGFKTMVLEVIKGP